MGGTLGGDRSYGTQRKLSKISSKELGRGAKLNLEGCNTADQPTVT